MLFPLTVTSSYDRFRWAPALPKVARYLARSGVFNSRFDRMTVALRETDRGFRLSCPDGVAKISLIETFERREFDISSEPIRARIAVRMAEQIAAGKRPLIIDAGANVGVTATYFALMYPEALVIAVEAQADNFERLQANTKALPNVEPRLAALHGVAGSTLRIVRPDGLGADAFRTVAGEGAPGEVATCSVRSLVEERPDCFPFMLKVDIEGHEKDIFAVDAELMDRFEAIFFEPHDWMLPGEGTSQSFLEFAAARRRALLVSGDKIVSVRSDRQAGAGWQEREAIAP